MNTEHIRSNYTSKHEIYLLNTYLVKRFRKSFGEICSIENTTEHLSNWMSSDSYNLHIKKIIQRHLERNNKNFISFFNKLKNNMRLQSSSYGFQSRDVYNIDYVKKFVDIDFFVKRMKEVEESISNINVDSSVKHIEFRMNKILFEDCLTGKIEYNDFKWYLKNNQFKS